MDIEVNKQNSIKIGDIYIDPYGIEEPGSAKYIFITHSHYDHYSPEDIDKIVNKNTVFIMPMSMKPDYDYDNDAIFVEPGKDYVIDKIKFETIKMYNIDKIYHKENYKWCGYIITIDHIKYYIMGDTDNIPEARNIVCDYLFIPIGGTFTMNVDEALECINNINYKYVIPTHYGSIVGSIEDGLKFKEKVGENCLLKIK